MAWESVLLAVGLVVIVGTLVGLVRWMAVLGRQQKAAEQAEEERRKRLRHAA